MKLRALTSIATAVLMLVAGVASAQVVNPTPTMVKIVGDPLTIHVGGDGSFQIFNSTVPGSGQIYPSSCTDTADMGIFANIDGTLYAPGFRSHSCSTATGNLGTYTPWASSGLAAVTGNGSSSSPFTASYRLTAPGTGVSIGVTVSYVNGQGYFRVRKRVTATTSRNVNVYLGADIYLASSDAGIFFYEPNLQAPGGHDCAVPSTYNILLIPITAASSFTASRYGDVWRQIGTNALDNDFTEEGCVDNGAAIAWNGVLRGRLTAELNSAVSFGDIPPASAFQSFALQVSPNFVSALPGDSLVFDVVTSHSDDSGFNSPISLSVGELPEGFTASLDKSVFPAPGDGATKLHVNVGPSVYPTMYRGITVLGTGKNATDEEEVHGSSATIDVLCDPPFILSLPSSQPKSQTVKKGSTVTLTVKPENGAAFNYQWYRGYAPLVGSPVAGANSASFTTGAVNDLQQYWVRVTNACGSADSQTATIIPID